MAPMLTARSACETFVLGRSIHAVGGWDGAQELSSVERYCVASDSWSEVSDMKMRQKRRAIGAHAMQLEVDLFDSLAAKAKRARQ